MPTIPITRKGAQLAKQIAGEIRAKGHFKGTETNYEDNVLDGVCIVSNSCFYGTEYSIDDRVSLIDSIIAEADLVATYNDYSSRRFAVVQWNDHSPTERVLEVLDKLSAE